MSVKVTPKVSIDISDFRLSPKPFTRRGRGRMWVSMLNGKDRISIGFEERTLVNMAYWVISLTHRRPKSAKGKES